MTLIVFLEVKLYVENFREGQKGQYIFKTK